MERGTTFEIIGTPKPRSLNSIGSIPLISLIAGGIVNPFGPTLTALAMEGSIEPGRKLPILRISLNPFSQEATELGVAHLGETWNPRVDFVPLFQAWSGSCPSMILPSSLLDRDEQVDLYAEFFKTFGDARALLDKIRRFPGDPWARVKHDVDEAGKLSRASTAGSKESSGKLDSAAARELAENLLDSKNSKAEFQAFLYAWRGSIDFQGGNAIAAQAMSFDDFVNLLSVLAISCKLPTEGS